MAMRAAAIKVAAVSTAAPRGLRALYSSLPGFSFNLPPTQVEKPPPAEPSTNLFVSGMSLSLCSLSFVSLVHFVLLYHLLRFASYFYCAKS